MSKAFTKDSDDPLDGVLVVDDAALPPGEINYLTPGGAATLRADIERLRAAPRGEPRHKVAIEQRLAALLRRLEAAQVIDPLAQPADRVLFGATVTVRDADARERVYRIVGVDEADARRGWVSWRSPMARALLNLRAGEVATVQTPGGESELEIVSIAYES
ncbi:MAG TPA: GreA/GreB family elongation factor [Kofleriaceae bacterium]|nr:GreA/GreB family elongation factor [Kofleriaceae bacterium]